MNNQALALAGAGRHDDALAIYPEAIDAQRACYEESPQSVMMRELLSKMYYNYRQTLQGAGRYDEAADVAVKRRDLWKDSPERLFGVAAELAELSRSMGENAKAIDLDKEVVATLRKLQDAGWPTNIDLADDERFDYLKGNQAFAALVAELGDRAQEVASQTKHEGDKSAPAIAN